MFSRKTDIVLSKTNLAALLFAMRAVQENFRPDATCLETHIRKGNRQHDAYEVEVRFQVPQKGPAYSRMPPTTCYTLVVRFCMKGGEVPVVNGEMFMYPKDSGDNFKLHGDGTLLFHYKDGVRETDIPEHTMKLLREYYERMADYLPYSFKPPFELA